MKHPRLHLLLLALLLVGFLLVLYIPRDKASDADIQTLLCGPLLPGAEDVTCGQWILISLSRTNAFFYVEGRTGSDADVAHCLRSSTEIGYLTIEDYWIVATGTPTETRLFDFLRTDAFSQDALSNKTRGGDVSLLWINHLTDNSFPSTNAYGRAKGLDEAETRAFRDRLRSFFNAEAARSDVVFREERTTFCLKFEVSVSEKPPGSFKHAVGWVCDQLDIPALEPVSHWAERGQKILDESLDWLSLSVQIVDGIPAPGVRITYGKDLPCSFLISDGTPLAEAIRKLCEKHRLQTLGRIHIPGQPMSDANAGIFIEDGENAYDVLLDYPTPRFRDFLNDILRLLANPPAPTFSRNSAETEF